MSAKIQIDVYIGEESNDHFDIDTMASLYNCKVVSMGSMYATVEGEIEDLEQFSDFWLGHSDI